LVYSNYFGHSLVVNFLSPFLPERSKNGDKNIVDILFATDFIRRYQYFTPLGK